MTTSPASAALIAATAEAICATYKRHKPYHRDGFYACDRCRLWAVGAVSFVDKGRALLARKPEPGCVVVTAPEPARPAITALIEQACNTRVRKPFTRDQEAAGQRAQLIFDAADLGLEQVQVHDRRCRAVSGLAKFIVHCGERAHDPLEVVPMAEADYWETPEGPAEDSDRDLGRQGESRTAQAAP